MENSCIFHEERLFYVAGRILFYLYGGGKYCMIVGKA